VAALNHPNICHIYDVGPNYLVMELVEGATLAGRIKQGAVPLEEALAIARQIGDALEAAHEKGIVHRDLKPANIKITGDGVVKVLDFGLAKIAEQAVAAGNPDESPTLDMGATVAGQIMGTPAYMAPEQARGRIVDKRADIWAFGVVLYEMVTARRLFESGTVPDTLAAVLTKDPDYTHVPAKLQCLLKSCLERDPKRRLHDIADAWRLIEDSAPAQATKFTGSWKLAAAALAVISALALWAPWRAAPPPSNPVQPVHLEFDVGVPIETATGPRTILSPDGSRLVFVAKGPEGINRLFTRRLDDSKAAPLPGTERAYFPFFSPDGQWLGFFASGQLKKTRIDGGDPVVLCNAPIARGASWTEDGNIIAALDITTGLSRLPAEGGTPVPLTELSPGELSHRYPQVLPGGKAAIFTITTEYSYHENAAIGAVTLKDRQRKILLDRAGTFPRYLSSGHLVYTTKGTLFAIPMDAERLEVRGSAVPLLEVAGEPIGGQVQVDFSRTGTMVYRTSSVRGMKTLAWLDTSGKLEPIAIEPGLYVMPHLSPDGGRLAMMVSQGVRTDLWIFDLQRGTKTRLTNGATFNSSPIWTPDGRHLVFQSAGGMYSVPSDASAKPEPLTESRNFQMPNSFTPDGATLVYTELNPRTGPEIRFTQVNAASGHLRAGTPRVFTKSAVLNTFAAVSPDGRWLAYADAEGGVYEMHVRAFPGGASHVQVSNAGGILPTWARNGRELFYRTDDSRIMVVSYIVNGDSFAPEKPREWSARPVGDIGGGAFNLDISPDGKRFIVYRNVETAAPQLPPNHVMLAINFFEEVRRRMAGPAK
jgi:serine/threonine-protein kinase